MELGNLTPFLSEGTLNYIINNVPVLDSPSFEQFGQGILEDLPDLPLGFLAPEDARAVALAVPSATAAIPELADWPGLYNFSVEVPNLSTERTKWIYSPKLNKVFCKPSTNRENVLVPVPVPFHVGWTGAEPGLYVRAMMVFLEEESVTAAVRRCVAHRHSGDPSNSGCEGIALHVVRCSDSRARYEEDPVTGRLSVRVPLDSPQAGSTYCPLQLTFVCKNSCGVGGINKRNTGIVFTLENYAGQVLGRHAMGIRVCSGPSRDRKKHESTREAEDADGAENAVPFPRQQVQLAPQLPKGKAPGKIRTKKPLKRLVRRDPPWKPVKTGSELSDNQNQVRVQFPNTKVGRLASTLQAVIENLSVHPGESLKNSLQRLAMKEESTES